MKKIVFALAIVGAVAAAKPISAAESVALVLMYNGMQIKGDSTLTSLGRADTIQCFAFELQGARTGTTRQWQALKIRKAIDKASPPLLNLYASNASLDATFRFYRPNPIGDGTTQQFYTVTLQQAHVSSIRQLVPETNVAGTATLPPMEEISFTFATMSITYTPTGVTANDAWTR